LGPPPKKKKFFFLKIGEIFFKKGGVFSPSQKGGILNLKKFNFGFQKLESWEAEI